MSLRGEEVLSLPAGLPFIKPLKTMHVTIASQQTDSPINSEQFTQIAEAVIAHEGVVCDEVSLNFVDKQSIGELHDLYFNDPSPTDCISFPIDDEETDEYRVLGEVVVCPKVALEYVAANGGSVEREVILYTVHGLLHVMGYDDIDPKDREEMRAAEKRHMAHLEDLGLCARIKR